MKSAWKTSNKIVSNAEKILKCHRINKYSSTCFKISPNASSSFRENSLNRWRHMTELCFYYELFHQVYCLCGSETKLRLYISVSIPQRLQSCFKRSQWSPDVWKWHKMFMIFVQIYIHIGLDFCMRMHGLLVSVWIYADGEFYFLFLVILHCHCLHIFLLFFFHSS